MRNRDESEIWYLKQYNTKTQVSIHLQKIKGKTKEETK